MKPLPTGPHIGWTFVATAALGLGLSSLPLPDALRPLPNLRKDPKGTLLAAIRPSGPKKAVPVQVDWDAEAAKEEWVFEPLDLTEEGLKAAARPIAAKPLRRTVEEEKERRRWDAIIRKVGAEHVPILDPCLDAACRETALTPWFDALDTLGRGKASEHVRMVVIGTSLIASDHITDTTRRLLQVRHGNGGLGYLFVDRPTRNAGRTVRTGTATDGWVIEKVTDNPPFAAAGLAGVAFTATTPQTTRFNAPGTSRVELFAMNQPGGGQLEVLGDGQLLARFDTDAPRRELSFPGVDADGATDFIIRTRGGPVRLDGVTFEAGRPGVVLDSLGLPGASAQVLLRDSPALFDEQLRMRVPTLVVLMIGGNDAFDMSLNRYDAKQAKAWQQQLIERVKSAAPGAACLLASPPDAGIWRMDETITPRTQTKLVAAYMKDLAKANGCALWDMQAAMGGEGAITRWWDAGLMNRDLVHPYALGGDVLGYLFETALEDARLDHHKKLTGERREQGQRPPQARPGVAARGVDATEPTGSDAGVAEPRYLERPEVLSKFFAKLRALEVNQTGRVAIMQLGASHTAAHFFTDHARRLLGERFGGLGRGFVAAGQPSLRIEQSGVRRELVGPWKVEDALEQKTSGLPWGLTGIRAEAQPGASLVMTFEETPIGTSDDTSHLQLFYYAQTGQPVPEVTIDGTRVPVFDYDGPDAGVRVLDFAAPGSQHFVAATNVSSEPMSFFGLSHELVKPGVVYDALGLPGATASVLSEYDQQALATQIAARQPDLYVLFFGTNESRLPVSKLSEMRKAYEVIFHTLKQSAPDAACLILSPTDQIVTRRGRKVPPESINEVIATMRTIAEENGCAFWATRDFMGGPGSIIQWRKDANANRDLIHLTRAGYQKLAEGMLGEVLRAYDTWSPPP